MANAEIIKILTITDLVEGGDIQVRPHDEHPVLVIEQGDDRIWVDTGAAKALAAFLTEWAPS